MASSAECRPSSMGDTPGGWQSESDSERGSVAVDAIDASASIEPAGLGTTAIDADGVRAAGGCHDDGTDDDGDGSGLEAAVDEGMGHGLGVRVGPSQITGVIVGVATGTGTGASDASDAPGASRAAVGVCTCTAGKIEGGGNDESRPCPREPQRVDEGEGVEPT